MDSFFAVEGDLEVVLQRMSRFYPKWDEVFDHEEVAGGRHAGVCFFLQLAAKGFPQGLAHFDGAADEIEVGVADRRVAFDQDALAGAVEDDGARADADPAAVVEPGEVIGEIDVVVHHVPPDPLS